MHTLAFEMDRSNKETGKGPFALVPVPRREQRPASRNLDSSGYHFRAPALEYRKVDMIEICI